MKVLITEAMHACGQDMLRENGCEILHSTAIDEETIIREAAGCDAIIVRAAPVTERLFSAVPTLRVVGKHGVGVENIDTAAAKAAGVHVCYTPTGSVTSVAEQAMMLLLNCAKKTRMMQKAVSTLDFGIRMRTFTSEVQGKTLGLIGCGRIGSALAKLAHFGFDMKIIGYDPYILPSVLPEWITLYPDKYEFLQNSDFVSIHLPLTDTTRNLINAQSLRMMKPTAYLINVARGAVVDEDALIEALRSGQIAGAGLDVMAKEPIVAGNPLLDMDNVIITPHSGASTNEAMERISAMVAEQVLQLLNGKEAAWQIC